MQATDKPSELGTEWVAWNQVGRFLPDPGPWYHHRAMLRSLTEASQRHCHGLSHTDPELNRAIVDGALSVASSLDQAVSDMLSAIRNLLIDCSWEAVGRRGTPEADLAPMPAHLWRYASLRNRLSWERCELIIGGVPWFDVQVRRRTPAIPVPDQSPPTAVGQRSEPPAGNQRDAPKDRGGPEREYDREPFDIEYKCFRAANPEATNRQVTNHMQNWSKEYYKTAGKTDPNRDPPSPGWVRQQTSRLRLAERIGTCG